MSSATNARAPVQTPDRIEAIDTLRGFALLGILVMNITGMALPTAAYFSPIVYGGSTGIDYATWVFSHLFFEQKMMGIFSMLFGAGLILMFDRFQASGRPFAGFYYRRIFLLLVIGLVHSYLIWHGDILVTYALVGFVLFLFRRRTARTLVISGLCFLVLGAGISAGGGFALQALRNVVIEIEGKVAAGAEMTPRRQGLIDQWDDVSEAFAPSPEQLEETVETMRGSPLEVLQKNIEETVSMHMEAVPFLLFWARPGPHASGHGAHESRCVHRAEIDAVLPKLDPGRVWSGVASDPVRCPSVEPSRP